MKHRKAGHYLLTEILGEGGFGTTYAAKDTISGEEYAIKEFFPGKICERITDERKGYHIHVHAKKEKMFQKELKRFRSEADSLKQCASFKTIARFVDFFEDHNTAYIVMEYIDGLTLETYIKENGPLDFEEMLSLFEPLLNDLEKVHALGIIHCDISPDNILIGMDNSIHLIDFGIAGSYLTDDKHHTLILKNGFAAPEQYSPSGKTGPWTDVYGISSTIYYAVTGYPLDASKERDENEENTLAKNLQGIKTWQKAALLKGMSVNISSRFPDIETFHLALNRKDVIGKLQTVQISSHSPRRKTGITVILAIAVLILTGLGVFALKQNDLGVESTSVKKNNPDENQSFAWTESDNQQQEPDETASHPSATVLPSMETLIPNTSDDKLIVPNPTSDDMLSMPKLTSDGSLSMPNPTSDDMLTVPKLTSNDRLTMPKLTGLKLAKARKKLHLLDDTITVKIIKKRQDTLAKNTVIRQGIPKGFSFEKGSLGEILLVVSTTEKRNPNPQTTAPDEPTIRSTKNGNSENNTKSTGNTKNTGSESSKAAKSSQNSSKNKTSGKHSEDKSTKKSTQDSFTVYGKDDYVDLDVWKE